MKKFVRFLFIVGQLLFISFGVLLIIAAIVDVGDDTSVWEFFLLSCLVCLSVAGVVSLIVYLHDLYEWAHDEN